MLCDLLLAIVGNLYVDSFSFFFFTIHILNITIAFGCIASFASKAQLLLLQKKKSFGKNYLLQISFRVEISHIGLLLLFVSQTTV